MNENSNNQNLNEQPIQPKKVKPKKSIMKIATILVVCGIVLSTLGWAMGGSRQSISIWPSKNGEEIIGTYTYLLDNNSNRNSKIFKTIQNLKLDRFNNIEIDVIHPNITIIESDNYGIDIGYDSSKDYKISYELKNNTLKVSDNLKHKFNINFNSRTNEYITIYIPSNSKFNDININTTSGLIMLNEPTISSEKLSLSSVSGEIVVGNLKSEKIKCETTSAYLSIANIETPSLKANSISGDIGVSDSYIKELKFESISGSINAENLNTEEISGSTVSGTINLQGDLRGDTSISSTSGEIILDIDSKKSMYNYDISSISGEININGDYEDKNINKNNSSASNDIKANTLSGSIELNFED